MQRDDLFGNWLRQRRKALDLTQFELAQQVGCALVTIKKIETRAMRPSKQMAERLADVLAISQEERTTFVAFARRIAAGPADAPLPTVIAGSASHNLPYQPTPFIGRAAELVEICQRLNDPACRLLTLAGPGGVGKTRLALEAARTQAAYFADGVHFVALTPVAAPHLVAAAIAGALKLTFYDPDDPAVAVVHYLREKAMLLILDNFEHLLEATSLLTDILAAAPRIKILVTSREALNLEEEWVRRVDGLSFPINREVEHTEDYSAIQMFAERARRVRANFSITDEWDSVVRICRLVQGMPLAIELAAAWLKTLPCARIADEIQHNLDFLASPLRNVTKRHRSIRAIFDHSWELLTSQEQAVFRTLAVFRGGFTLEAAEQVANASLQIMTIFVDKSLLQCMAAGRYDLHELLRQYADQHLESAGASANARAAHSAYYMDFLAQRDADIKGRRQTAALNEISADFENIRTAWQWAQDHRQYGAISQALNCLINFADMRSSLPAVLGLLQQTAAALTPASGELPHPAWERVVVRREGANFALLARLDHVPVETILEHARERGDRDEIAWCLSVLMAHVQLAGDPVRYVAIAEEHLALRRALGDEFYIASALIGLSLAYDQDRQIERDLECVREGVAIRRRIGDIQGLSGSLSVLGRCLVTYGGSLSEAETYFDEGISLQEAHGKSQIYVSLTANKSALAFWRGDFEAATRLAEMGLDFARNHDYVGVRSHSLAVLSFVQCMAGSYAQSLELCEQTRQLGIYPPRVKVWIDWGTALANCGLGDDTAAAVSLRTALASLNSPSWKQRCLPLAGILATRSGDFQRGVELLGLTATAPRSLMGWLDRWPLMTGLKSELKAKLGAEAYESAWEHGKTLALDAVVAELLGNQPMVQEPDRR